MAMLKLVSQVTSDSRALIAANQSTNDALDLNALRRLDEDWFELRIRRLEPNKVRFAIELFHRRIIAIDQRHHYLSVLGRLLCRDDDDVVVLDILFNHRIATYPERVHAPATSHITRHGDGLVRKDRFDWLTGRYSSQQGNLVLVVSRDFLLHDFNAAADVGNLCDQAFTLQRRDDVMHARR